MITWSEYSRPNFFNSLLYPSNHKCKVIPNVPSQSKITEEYSDQVIIDDFFYEHKKTMLNYPDMDFDAFIENVRKYMISHVSHMKLYEGEHETLEKLQENNIKLALVSSSPGKLLEEALELTDLSKFFSAISGFDDIMKHKPDPEPFLYIIEVAKLDPKNTI